MFSGLAVFWHSIRPKTLTLSLAPALLALALTQAKGDLGLFALAVGCTLLMQIGANMANDYYDVKGGVDGQRLGPLRPLQKGEIAPEKVRAYFLLCFSLALLIGLYLAYAKGIGIFIIGIISILVAYGYTGGPFPLSHYCLGEVFAFLFFGPVATLGAVWILQESFIDKDIFVSLAPGFLAALLMGVNNQRDAKTDRRAKKYTLASVLGESFARKLNLFFLFVVVALPLLSIFIFDFSLWALATLLPFVLFVKYWALLFKDARERELISLLEATGKYTLLYSATFALGIYL